MAQATPLVGAVLLVAAFLSISTGVLLWSDNRMEARSLDRQAAFVTDEPRDLQRLFYENEADRHRSVANIALGSAGALALAFVISSAVVLAHTTMERPEHQHGSAT